MPKSLGLERKPGYWDRHKKRWIVKNDHSAKGGDHINKKQMGGQYIPFDDSRTIKCPICGEMVHYATRRLHSCHYEYMKQVQADAAEFEAGMVISINGGKKNWN